MKFEAYAIGKFCDTGQPREALIECRLQMSGIDITLFSHKGL